MKKGTLLVLAGLVAMLIAGCDSGAKYNADAAAAESAAKDAKRPTADTSSR